MGKNSSLIGKKFDSEPIYGDSDKFIKTKINSNGSNDYDLMQKAMNFNDVTIVSVKESDYKFHFCYMSKNDAVSITNNSNFIDKKGCFVIFLLIYKK